MCYCFSSIQQIGLSFFLIQILHSFYIVSLSLQSSQADAYSVRVGTEALAIRERSDSGSEVLETVDGGLLRREVLLE